MATSTSRSEPAVLDVAAIRRDFPLLASGAAYLDSANTAQRPRQVVEAMEAYFNTYNANIHRGAYTLSERATEQYEAARDKVRAFINAPSRREVIWTSGTTEGINLVAYSWGRAHVSPGDLIVLTVMEHHSNLVPWQLLAEERGARIEYVDIDEHGRLRQEHYRQLLERRPKLVAFGHVSNTLGTVNPVAEMSRLAHEVGAVVLVDGAQGAPHERLDVQALGCDFYAFSSHKMCGPTGVGVLWGRRELLEAMRPFKGGGDMIKVVSLEGSTFADLPQKFEAGTQAIAEVIGLGAAVDYLESAGREAIRAHEHRLTDYAWEALTGVDGMRVFGPPPGDDRAGVLSFDLEGIHPHDLATILDRHGVSVRAGHNCTQPLMHRLGVAATARASFYLYTETAEIDRLVEGLKDAKRIFGV